MQTVKQKRYFIDPQTLPPGVKLEQIERVLEREESQKVQSLEATQRALKDLMSTYQTSRLKILGEEGNRVLNEFMQQYRQGAPADVAQPQSTSLEQVAKGLQRRLVYPEPIVPVKTLQSLKALNADTKQKFDAIIEAAPAPAKTSQSADVPSSDLNLSPPVAYYPPYGWWERNTFDNYDLATGSGQIKLHQSYLWAEGGQTGSCIWGQNFSAGNIDLIQMVRGNGFFLGYTTPQTGILCIQVDMECSFCEHCISTWDEFGWSDVSAVTREILSVGVLYNWEDPDLGAELRDEYFVSGLRASGDGENSPGVVYPVPAKTKRSFVKYINVTLPAGTGVYIYVGTEQQAWAWLNDVSCNIFTNSAWYVTRVRVRTV